MGLVLVNQLLPVLDRMRWPFTPRATQLGYKAYEHGIDKADTYRDDAKVLGDALRIFQTADSQPYAFAGIAYTLVLASREEDGSYAQEGLDAAMLWLEKAQELEPDLVEINFIESLVYIYGNRPGDARMILDYLRQQEPANYFLQRSEVTYWRRQGDMKKVVYWCEKAMVAADTIPQRLRLQGTMADGLYELGEMDKALHAYKEAVHFDANNHEAWHGLAVINWQRKNYDEATRLNNKALKIRDFPAGRKLALALERRTKPLSISSWLRRR